MKKSPWVAGTMMTAALATGCMMEPQSDRDIETLPSERRVNGPDDGYRVVREAFNARIKGTVGPVTLDSTARPSVYDDGWYLSVESVVELDNRAAMTLLSVSNGGEIFMPGLKQTFNIEDYASDGPSVTMLGCVGQEVGVYDEYDMPADEVDVEITPGETEDEMVVALGARWNDRNELGERLETYRAAETTFTLAH